MQGKRFFGILPISTVLTVAAALLVGSVPARAQQPSIAGLTTQFPNSVYSYTMYNNEYWNIYGSNLGSGGTISGAYVQVTWQTSYIAFGLIQSRSHTVNYGARSSQYWWVQENQLNFFANGTFDIPPGVPTSNVTALTATLVACNFGCSLPTTTGVVY